MRKKIVYIGLGLILASLIVFVIAGNSTSSAINNLAQTVNTTNVTIAAHSFNALKLAAPSNSLLLLAVSIQNGKANFYFFNSSAYATWTAGVGSNSTGLSRALSLEGKGVYVIYNGVFNASVPSSLVNASKSLLYTTNESKQYPAGTYYAVIDNTNGSVSSGMSLNGRIAYVPPFNNASLQGSQYSQLSGALKTGILYGLIFFILFVVGIIVVIYGVIKKPEVDVAQAAAASGKVQASKQQMQKEYVDQLYKNVGKRKRR